MSKYITYILTILIANTCLLLFSNESRAAEWQWSVPVEGIISAETKEHPTAFLWIPPNCKQVRGIVVGQHNMLEEGILEHTAFRKKMTKLGFAEIWITPGMDMIFKFQNVAVFNDMMKSLAHKSGYSELEFSPIVPIGHSAAASYPWNFGACNPSRTLAMLSIHGDAPVSNLTGSGQPNPDWGTHNIDGIPGLMVMGEYEWWEERIIPAMKYKKLHPKAVISYLADAGNGHFDYSDELIDFLGMFITKVANVRLPSKMPLNKPVLLKPIDPDEGWLVDKWRRDKPLEAEAARYNRYKGNKEEAGWALDGRMARATESYYVRARAKLPQYIGYIQEGKLLAPAGFSGFNPKFKPHADGISFNISAVYLDSVGGKRAAKGYSKSKIHISRICGPIEKVDDTTFKVAFYRMGFNNPKRSNDVWLMARSAGDEKYKSAVQQADMRIPLKNTEGSEQYISFPIIPAQEVGLKSMMLNAMSSSGMPVFYYVKEGPAEIWENKLMFTEIPPRSKFPLKVTVVAWQYGRSVLPMVKSAEPVELSFYIHKN
ncbi:hypothetical protein LPB86_05315 [Pedobacter sp. MC2016-14]|uniref:hypothetical protein n=1 Tax=Pedobacter sp. MC2016-14 TaxID=2897327 RepID=UPI001E308DF2|nr:hypothetical protein [Pedobacter sp. MC2016-14]MCD0487636.1 hypothetical protein [Pedobacter sp. MC2016-14]